MHGRTSTFQYRPSGFTLTEVLIVLAIVGVLVALLIPAVQQARESAARRDCQHRLREIGLALLSYEQTQRAMPAGCIGCRFETLPPGAPFVPQRFLSWNVQLLPYLEEQPLYDRFDFDRPSYQSPNREAGATILPIFLCPTTDSEVTHNKSGLWRGLAFSDYAGVYGVEGTGRSNTDPVNPHWLKVEFLGVMLYEVPTRVIDISDGLSRTVVVAETALRRITESEWANGNNLFAQEGTTPINRPSGLGNEIGSPHWGGASVVYCDGHVEFLEETIDQQLLNAMLTRAGGELERP